MYLLCIYIYIIWSSCRSPHVLPFSLMMPLVPCLFLFSFAYCTELYPRTIWLVFIVWTFLNYNTCIYIYVDFARPYMFDLKVESRCLVDVTRIVDYSIQRDLRIFWSSWSPPCCPGLKSTHICSLHVCSLDQRFLVEVLNDKYNDIWSLMIILFFLFRKSSCFFYLVLERLSFYRCLRSFRYFWSGDLAGATWPEWVRGDEFWDLWGSWMHQTQECTSSEDSFMEAWQWVQLVNDMMPPKKQRHYKVLFQFVWALDIY